MKILCTAMLLLCTPALADDSLTVHMQAEATFIHAQVIEELGITLLSDVTGLVPHEVQIVDGQKIVVIQ